MNLSKAISFQTNTEKLFFLSQKIVPLVLPYAGETELREKAEITRCSNLNISLASDEEPISIRNVSRSLPASRIVAAPPAKVLQLSNFHLIFFYAPRRVPVATHL